MVQAYGRSADVHASLLDAAFRRLRTQLSEHQPALSHWRAMRDARPDSAPFGGWWNKASSGKAPLNGSSDRHEPALP